MAFGLQAATEQGQQARRVYGLREVVARSRLEAALALPLHRLRGERDRGHVREARVPTQAAQGFVAVHLGHHDVHQDGVHLRVLAEHLEHLPPVLGDQHVRTLAAQKRGERVDRAHVVVRDEDARAAERHVRQERGARGKRWRPRTVGAHVLHEQAHLLEQALARAPVFEHDRLGVRFDATDFLAREAATGVHHDRRHGQAVVRAQGFEQPEAVHVGQAEVEDHAAVALLAERLEGSACARHVARVEPCALQEVDQGVAFVRVVLDHQHLRLVVFGRLEEQANRADELVRRSGLGQIAHGAERKGALRRVDARDEMHGHRARGRILSQALHHRPAVDIRQAHVEDHSARLARLGDEQRFLAGRRHDRVEAARLHHLDESLREDAVVLDDEQVGLLAGERRALGGFGRLGTLGAHGRGGWNALLRQVAGERAAAPLAALQHQIAAEQQRRFARDGEPETRAAEAPIRARLGLLERREDAFLRGPGDADSGVRHGEGDARRGVELRRSEDAVPQRPVDAELDLAALRELEGVAEQVHEDALDALAIGDDPVRQARLELDAERDALGLGCGREQALCSLGELRQGHLRGVHVLLPGFDLREIQHLVDEAEEVLAGRVDRLRVLDLLGRQVLPLVLGQEVGEQQHAVERCP
jgi:hypothetical protein